MEFLVDHGVVLRRRSGPAIGDAPSPFVEQWGDGIDGVVGDGLVNDEEGEHALRVGILSVTRGAQPDPASSLDRNTVGARDGVRYASDQQQRRVAAAVAGSRAASVDLDGAYDATAIPGMCLSSPSSADVTLTGKSWIASGVSRLR